MNDSKPAAVGPSDAEGLQSPAMRARLRLGTIVLLSAVGFSSLLSTALTPALSKITAHFGGGGTGDLTAQNIVTMAAVGILIGSPLVGLVSKWIDTRRILILSLAIYAVAGSAGMYLESTTALLASRFVQGLGTAGISVATASMIGDRFRGNQRAQFLGYRDAFIAVFGFVALQGSGLLADVAGWRANFALYLLAVPMIGLVFLSVFPKVESAETATGSEGERFKLLSLWPFYLMVLGLYIAAYTLYLNLSFLMAEDNITSSALQGRILATSTVMHFIGGMLYGRIVGKIGSRWMFMAVLLGMALSDFTIGFAQSTVWIVVGTGLAGLSGGNMQVYMVNLLLGRVPAANRPQALGFMYTAMFVGQFLNPFIATPLRLWVGNHNAFLVVGAALLIFAVVQFIVRSKQQD